VPTDSNKTSLFFVPFRADREVEDERREMEVDVAYVCMCMGD